MGFEVADFKLAFKINADISVLAAAAPCYYLRFLQFTN
jgi:hypothetical protein